MKFKGKRFDFTPTELLREKALEMLKGVELANYAKGVGIGHGLGAVYAREYERLKKKYGEEHPRTAEAKLRIEVAGQARKSLLKRHSDVASDDSGRGGVKADDKKGDYTWGKTGNQQRWRDRNKDDGGIRGGLGLDLEEESAEAAAEAPEE